MAVQTTLDQLPSPHSSSDFRSLSPLSTNHPDQSPTPRSSVSSSRPIGSSFHPSPPLPSSTLPRPYSSALSGSAHKPQRSSSALLNFAAAALDKTQSAFANTLDPVVRPRQSNSALARLSLNTGSPSSSESVSPIKASAGASAVVYKGKTHTTPPSSSFALADPHPLDPPSQRYSETNPNTLPPLKLPATDSKMHQTSSRLLRMTDDDRPFTKVRLLARSHARVRGAVLRFTLPAMAGYGPSVAAW